MANTKKNIEAENESLNAFQSSAPEGDLMSDFANAGSSGMDSDEMMDMDTSDVYDEIIHPTGTEVKVRIHSVTSGVSEKTESKYWKIVLEDVNDPHVKRINTFLSFIGPNDDTRAKNNKKKNFMKFRAAFGYADGEPLSMNGLIGKEAWCIVRMSESEQYGQQNEVKQWIQSGQGTF